mgnify:CR=1 FL=1
MKCDCHGVEMRWASDARCTRSGGYWRCTVKVSAYDTSEKGIARHRKHNAGRIGVHIGDTVYSYRVPPERKTELMERLAQYRADRSTERREARNGWLNQTVTRA